MSETEAIPTESVKTEEPSVETTTSIDSSKVPTAIKPSGIKPPSTSRIGRICTGHGLPKAGPPPIIETKSEYSIILLLNYFYFHFLHTYCFLKPIKYLMRLT